MLRNVLSGGFSLIDILIYFLSSMVVVFLVLPIHEFAHGWTATKLGDPSARYDGRLSLNPMAHIDWMGAACILLFGFGWAKPVRVNARYFRNPKRDMAITAAAGPLSNLVMGFLFMFLSYATYVAAVRLDFGLLSYLISFFYFVAQINVALAIFNLIPIPPFDGSRLLSAFLPDRHYYKLMQYEQYFMIGVFVLLFTGILDRPLSMLNAAVLSGMERLVSLPFTVFMR